MSSSSKKKENPDLKKYEVLQAVVMCDSFDNKFGPLTKDLPRCLLPLANRPILGYTLEFLKNSGVEEVFVYCATFAHKVKQYLEASQWTHSRNGGMNVIVITNEDCRSFGDAMRDLDGKALLRHDFILLNGDTVSNVDLRPIVEAHKKRAQVDKTSSMTLVYKKAAPSHHCRTVEEEVILAVDAKDGKILHHQRARSAKLNIPLEIFEENPEVELRFDLLDPCISVCSHAIPLLFADNFDFQNLDDFLTDLLKNDLLDNTIYMAQVDEAYAARVSSFHSYMAINMDVINRWLYPIVPDMNLGCEEILPYKFHRHNVYKCDDARLMRGALLEKDVILGQSCIVDGDSMLLTSSVGANCKIGKNVTIKNSIIFDGAEVEDGCQIDGCIIARGVKVMSNAVLNARCILGTGVVVEKSTNLPEETLLVATKPSDGFSDEEKESDDSGGYGPKAHVYFFEDGSDVDSDNEGRVSRDIWGSILEECDASSTTSEESSEFGMAEATVTDILLDEDAKISVFHHEIFETLQRGARDNADANNLVVEINSSRCAYATTQGNVIHSIVTSLLTIAEEAERGLSGAKLFKEVQKVLKQFTPLLTVYCKSPAAQLSCLYALEEHSQNHKEFVGIAKNTVHFLYEEDVLAEGPILQWFADEEKKFPEFGPRFRDSVKPFIKWLQEADSEDDDDSD